MPVLLCAACQPLIVACAYWQTGVSTVSYAKRILGRIRLLGTAKTLDKSNHN